MVCYIFYEIWLNFELTIFLIKDIISYGSKKKQTCIYILNARLREILVHL